MSSQDPIDPTNAAEVNASKAQPNGVFTEFMDAFRSNNLEAAQELMEKNWSEKELKKTIFEILNFESTDLVDIKILGEFLELLANKRNKLLANKGNGLKSLFDESGKTPLIYAIMKNNHELVELLLRLGADPNENGYPEPQGKACTPITCAILYSKAGPDLCRLLLANNADPNPRHRYATVPLLECMRDFEKRSLEEQKQCLECFEILLEAGANPFTPLFDGKVYISLQSYATGLRYFEFAKILEKRIMDLKLTDKQIKQREYLKNISFIKKMGHSLGLSQYVKLNPIEPWMDSKIDTEAIYSFEAIQELCQELKDYCNHISGTKPYETWNKIYNAFKATEQYLLGTLNADDMRKRIKNNELTILNLTMDKHTLTLTIYDGQLLVSNKGLGKIGTGLSVYKLEDKDFDLLQKEKFIESLYPSGAIKLRSPKDAFSILEELIGDKKPWAELPAKGQPHGTCEYTNAQAIGEFVHFIDEFNILKQENNIDPKLSYAEVEEKEKENWRKLKDKAEIYGVTEKKKFTHFRRESKINVIANGNQMDSLDNDLYIELTRAFLNQHYSSPDLSPKKAKKRFYELEFAYTLLQSLDLETRGRMLDKLEKNGIDLYELSDKVRGIIKDFEDKDSKDTKFIGKFEEFFKEMTIFIEFTKHFEWEGNREINPKQNELNIIQAILHKYNIKMKGIIDNNPSWYEQMFGILGNKIDDFLEELKVISKKPGMTRMSEKFPLFLKERAVALEKEINAEAERERKEAQNPTTQQPGEPLLWAATKIHEDREHIEQNRQHNVDSDNPDRP